MVSDALADIPLPKLQSGAGTSVLPTPARVPVSVDDMTPGAYTGQTGPTPFQFSWMDGEKFVGGFGPTQLFNVDYWGLRQRSAQLFQENLYAKGIVRRLVTNEINTGLTPEAMPNDEILGMTEDQLSDWSEFTETLFDLWGKNPNVCDWKKESTFGDIQRQARQEALISGDVLVVLRSNPATKLPQVQLISGDKVRTPLFSQQKSLRTGHTIQHGVELDRKKRVVAYWIVQDGKDRTGLGEMKRLPAFGEKSGRRLSWLVFGTDKRLDEVRGQPLLGIVLQSLKEIDRYRDSTQRKATINSIVAMWIKKTNDKPGSLPIQGGATRHDDVTHTDSTGTARTFKIESMNAGAVMEELEEGEEPVMHAPNSADQSFGEFEEAIIQAVAWANEIPPEILKLAFSNNYSASQAAINEFKIYLNKVWAHWGDTFCTPIYKEWLVAEALLQKIAAPRLLEAWRNPAMYDVFGAWVSVIWYGSIKPSTDMLKQAKGSKLLLEMGLTTNAREARQLTGTKYSHNVKKLRRENEQKVDALRPLLEFMAELGESPDTGTPTSGEVLDALEEFKLWAQETLSL